MSYVVPADLLAQISDADFYRELTRRNLAKRGDKVGGRPKKLVACTKCGVSMGVRELRLHTSQCKAERALAAQRNG